MAGHYITYTLPHYGKKSVSTGGNTEAEAITEGDALMLVLGYDPATATSVVVELA